MKPLTAEERRAIINAPITVGVLATKFNNVYHGMAGAGSRGDTPKLPVQNYRTNAITGWMSNATPRT